MRVLLHRLYRRMWCVLLYWRMVHRWVLLRLLQRRMMRVIHRCMRVLLHCRMRVLHWHLRLWQERRVHLLQHLLR